MSQFNGMLTVASLIELRLKMKMALATIPTVQKKQAAILDRWLDSVPLPLENDVDQHMEYEVSVTANLSRLTWCASGPSTQFIPLMATFFNEVGAEANAMNQLSQLGERLQPPQLGSWIEVRPESLDGGWHIPDTLVLTEAIELIQAKNCREAIINWANEFGINTCLSLGHSMGGGYPRTEFRIRLPGETITQQLEIGIKLLEALEAPALPIQAIAALQDARNLGLIASVWLTHEGVAKVGLLSPQPSTQLIVQLCMVDQVEEDGLAAFQGSLDVDAPQFIEVQQVAEGFSVELHYKLL